MIKSINLTPFVQYPPTIQFIPCRHYGYITTLENWELSRGGDRRDPDHAGCCCAAEALSGIPSALHLHLLNKMSGVGLSRSDDTIVRYLHWSQNCRSHLISEADFAVHCIWWLSCDLPASVMCSVAYLLSVVDNICWSTWGRAPAWSLPTLPRFISPSSYKFCTVWQLAARHTRTIIYTPLDTRYSAGNNRELTCSV